MGLDFIIKNFSSIYLLLFLIINDLLYPWAEKIKIEKGDMWHITQNIDKRHHFNPTSYSKHLQKIPLIINFNINNLIFYCIITSLY